MPRTIAEKDGRVYEFWCGRQAVAGKTTALRSRVRDLARHASVQSVWVLDRLSEWGQGDNLARLGVKSVAVYRSESDYHQSDVIPRVVIWQLGTSVDRYVRVMAEAVHLGDCALVLDEAYEYAPAGAKWTGPNILREIVLAGRHLKRADGDMRPTHLLVATQYPRTVHHLVWAQAFTVMVGRLSGKASFEWVRENFGEAAEERARELEPHQWFAAHGEKPPMPGYGAEG